MVGRNNGIAIHWRLPAIGAGDHGLCRSYLKVDTGSIGGFRLEEMRSCPEVGFWDIWPCEER